MSFLKWLNRFQKVNAVTLPLKFTESLCRVEGEVETFSCDWNHTNHDNKHYSTMLESADVHVL